MASLPSTSPDFPSGYAAFLAQQIQACRCSLTHFFVCATNRRTEETTSAETIGAHIEGWGLRPHSGYAALLPPPQASETGFEHSAIGANTGDSHGPQEHREDQH